jgi:hypothetical protein
VRRSALSLLLLSATSCRQIFGLHELTGDGGGDGKRDSRGGDAPGDGGSDSTPVLGDAPAGCLGAIPYAVCFPQQPANNGLVLSGTINTDSDSRCESSQPTNWTPDQPAACFLYGRDIVTNEGVPLSVSGSRPLVLVATNTISLAGPLDVASHINGTDGPAANYSGCGPGTGAPPGNKGGGAGGSFTSSGGNGGGTGGVAGAVLPGGNALHGGCGGGPGDASGGSQGLPGDGGGVVYLVAAVSITIGAQIDASGAGAKGGSQTGGGGGGGSGGMIVMIAPMIDLTGATIYADGGGGGGGGSGAAPGADGSDPLAAMAGLGGQEYGKGGTGYHDSIAADVGGMPMFTGGGGGGGGGGAGYIVLSGTVKPADRVSPPAH